MSEADAALGDAASRTGETTRKAKIVSQAHIDTLARIRELRNEAKMSLKELRKQYKKAWDRQA